MRVAKKVQIAAVVEPETLRRVDADRATRRNEDNKQMSRSAVVQEALELWLEVAANEDRERATRVSDQIEATQDLVNAGVERLAKMVYQAQLKSEMAYQTFISVSPRGSEVDRDQVSGSGGEAARRGPPARCTEQARQRLSEPESTSPSFSRPGR